MKKTKNSLIAFFFVYYGNIAVIYLFVFPCKKNIIYFFNSFFLEGVKEMIWLILFSVLVGLVTIFFLRSWLINPAVIKKEKSTLLVKKLFSNKAFKKELMENNDYANICPECEVQLYYPNKKFLFLSKDY